MSHPSQADHFLFNSSLFAPKLRMMLRGIRVDQSRLEELKAEAAAGVWRLQALIDQEAGGGSDFLYRLNWTDPIVEIAFSRLCLSCLGGSNPRVRQNVTVERWQPMKWQSKGNPWKRAGKLVTVLPEGWSGAVLNGDWPSHGGLAYCPKHKTISRLQSFTPSTLAEVEPHVLESKWGEWRRVKQIWKELKDERNTDEVRRNCDGDSFEQRGCEIKGGSGESGLDGSRSALLGELSTLLGLAINAGSNSEGGDSQWFLYECCGLPRIYCDAKTGRYSRETEAEWRKRTKEGVSHGRKKKKANRTAINPTQPDAEGLGAGGQGGAVGDMDGESIGVLAGKSSKRLSTDQIALARLYAYTQDLRVLWILQQRRLRKVVTDLSTKLDADGRLRASISLVKETGRMSESAAPTGCGLNRQALNKDLLSICIPDEGYEMAKLDLEGADSWTVAAEAAALGDETMLEDLRAGLKPAKVICLLYHEGLHVNGMFRDEIRDHCERMKFPAWLYPAAKACCHGSSYAMGWETMQMTLLKNSMADLPLDLRDSKPIVLSKKQIDDLQGAFFSRYPGVKLWQQKVARQLMEKGYLQTSTGHVRRFYGRKTEISKGRKVVNHETWKEALSSLPQYYTTWSIKQAWSKMWFDESNWRWCDCVNGSLPVDDCLRCEGYGVVQIVEPLALKHDEILMQWRKEDRAWALKKLPEWFRTPVRIAGIEVVIPAAGKIGMNWGMKEGETIRL